MPKFDLTEFLPYLLNQAADAQSLEFQKEYKAQYGMLRTEWRVLFHLGCYGPMTAKEICDRARIHKTKTSRAVAKLEARRYLKREQLVQDKRHEKLSLTKEGSRVFEDLKRRAQNFNSAALSQLSAEEARVLKTVLARIAGL